MPNETPFRIAVLEDRLANLHAKLDLVTFPDELEDAGWDYGVPLADVKRLVARWKDGYDWRKHERALNEELCHFTRDIDVDGHGTLNIHYVHHKSEVKGAIPLLFVHGWPGSFIEVKKILPMLVDGSPSFHVVAPSLPGYGFSEAPSRKGFGIPQYAEAANKLMLSLGYNEYVTQGGDWGGRITRRMASTYGGISVMAWNTNFPMSTPPRFLTNPLSYLQYLVTPYNDTEKASIQHFENFLKCGRGYEAELSTQPQTLGYNLADSPVGLLAWIYEKLVHWTDSYLWDDDEVLTWVSIYWFSRAGPTAASRIYYEFYQSKTKSTDLGPASLIPMGTSYFHKENLPYPRSWINREGNVVFEGRHLEGGHFPSYEVPHLLVSDLRKMFEKGGPAYGAVKGRNGYDVPM